MTLPKGVLYDLLLRLAHSSMVEGAAPAHGFEEHVRRTVWACVLELLEYLRHLRRRIGHQPPPFDVH